jgi:hypothetical protein
VWEILAIFIHDGTLILTEQVVQHTVKQIICIVGLILLAKGCFIWNADVSVPVRTIDPVDLVKDVVADPVTQNVDVYELYREAVEQAREYNSSQAHAAEMREAQLRSEKRMEAFVWLGLGTALFIIFAVISKGSFGESSHFTKLQKARSVQVSGATKEFVPAITVCEFSCPSCAQNLICEESMAGMLVKCSACGAIVVVPPK